jgi:ribose-phosphate pyrophosphokinase
MRVTVGPSSPTVIIYAPLDRPNDKLLAILFAAEALRRGGTKRLVLVAPYLCYMRQDAAFHAGEAISQRAVCCRQMSIASSRWTLICIAP